MSCRDSLKIVPATWGSPFPVPIYARSRIFSRIEVSCDGRGALERTLRPSIPARDKRQKSLTGHHRSHGNPAVDLLMNQEPKQILAGRDQKYRNQTHPNFVEPDRKCNRNSDYRPVPISWRINGREHAPNRFLNPTAYLGFQLRTGSLDNRRQCFAGPQQANHIAGFIGY